VEIQDDNREGEFDEDAGSSGEQERSADVAGEPAAPVEEGHAAANDAPTGDADSEQVEAAGNGDAATLAEEPGRLREEAAKLHEAAVSRQAAAAELREEAARLREEAAKLREQSPELLQEAARLREETRAAQAEIELAAEPEFDPQTEEVPAMEPEEAEQEEESRGLFRRRRRR
jgi:hypothetical protein